MNDLSLRYAVKEDLPALCRIWALSFGDDEALIRQFFLESSILSTTLVCECKGHICGMMAAFDGLRFEGKATSYLYALCTHPQHRRQGIGEALTRESAKLAFQRGSELVCLHPADERLARWYERLGFSAVPGLSRSGADICALAGYSLEPLSPEDYGKHRHALGAPALPLSLLRVQALFCREYGGGLYAVNGQGLACVEGERLLEAVGLPFSAGVQAPLMFAARENTHPPSKACLPFVLD